MQLYTINATSYREFTLYEVVGFWMGKRERSYKIEVATELDFDVIAELCEQIRHVYNQDAVILQCGETVKFIERP